MSKARSPREVCSTTMGTKGLIARASLIKEGTVARDALRPRPSAILARSPEAAFAALGLLLLGRPELLARDGLLLRDRLRRAGNQLGGLAQPKLLAEQRVAAVGAKALQESRRSLPFFPRLKRLHHLLLRDLDPLGLGDRRQGGFAAQRPLGVRLEVGDCLLARLALHLQVSLGVGAPRGQRTLETLPHLVGARVDELFRQLDPGRVGRGVHHGLAELRLDPALQGGTDPPPNLIAKLIKRLELRGLGGELVIESRQPLLSDLLDPHREAPLPARQALGLVVVREANVDRQLVPGRGAGERPVELRKQALGS